MQWADPWLLAGLALVPVLAWRHHRRHAARAVRYSSVELLRGLTASRRAQARRLVEGLRWLTLALLLIAAARPQQGHELTSVRTEGIDIVLALDASGSMAALDLEWSTRRRNRLAVAKEVVADFVRGRPNDRIGLVVFGSEAFTQCPLTLDHGVLLNLLDEVSIGVAGDSTAIGSAIGVAAKRLQRSQATSKVVVLLTDGRNNAGSLTPERAAEAAKTLGVKIYTIGAGTKGKAPFEVETIFGKTYQYQKVDLDEDSLRRIAEMTGGRFFRATDAESLHRIYEEIDQLERTEIDMSHYMEWNERFAWFAVPALALLLVEVVLLNTLLRKIP